MEKVKKDKKVENKSAGELHREAELARRAEKKKFINATPAGNAKIDDGSVTPTYPLVG